jgi:hypothetical protein
MEIICCAILAATAPLIGRHDRGRTILVVCMSLARASNDDI